MFTVNVQRAIQKYQKKQIMIFRLPSKIFKQKTDIVVQDKNLVQILYQN